MAVVVVVLKFLLIVLLTYAFTTFLGYWVHWLLHQRWAGFASKAHMRHHIRLYPPKDLVSEKYRFAGKESTIWLFLPVVLVTMGLPMTLAYFGLVSWFYAVLVAFEIAGLALLHNFVHDDFHLLRGRFTFIPGYDRLRKIHFRHHSNMKKNFGILDFIWDRVFKTYEN